MEPGPRTLHHGHLCRTPSFPRAPVLVLGGILALAAVVSVGTYLAFPSGSDEQAFAAEALIAGSCFLSGGIILRAVGKGRGWPGSAYLAWALFLLGAVSLVFLTMTIRDPGLYVPGPSDLAFALFLVPIVGLARAEYREHFEVRDRREIGVDVFLITASLTALLYVMIRPIEADVQGSLAAGIFAALTAVQIAAFGACCCGAAPRRTCCCSRSSRRWPRRPLRSDGSGPTGRSTAPPRPSTSRSCCARSRSPLWSSTPPDTRRAWSRSRVDGLDRCSRASRWWRPVPPWPSSRRSDAARGIEGVQSVLIIGLLGVGVAARILSNQIASTQAHQATAEALAEKADALDEADAALERVREANETLRENEEHSGSCSTPPWTASWSSTIGAW